MNQKSSFSRAMIVVGQIKSIISWILATALLVSVFLFGMSSVAQTQTAASSQLRAAESASTPRSSGDVIELGELKVQGEVRRPSVDIYHLKALSSQQLETLATLSFVEFEKQLLCRSESEGTCETP